MICRNHKLQRKETALFMLDDGWFSLRWLTLRWPVEHAIDTPCTVPRRQRSLQQRREGPPPKSRWQLSEGTVRVVFRAPPRNPSLDGLLRYPESHARIATRSKGEMELVLQAIVGYFEPLAALPEVLLSIHRQSCYPDTTCLRIWHLVAVVNSNGDSPQPGLGMLNQGKSPSPSHFLAGSNWTPRHWLHHDPRKAGN